MNITNERVTEYLETLYRSLNGELKQLRDVADEHNVPVVLKDSETFILNTIRMKRPRRILEIGTAMGYSAICFAHVAPEAEIVSLERSDRMYRYALANIEKFQLTNRIRIIEGDAMESLKKLAGEIHDPDSDGFDFVFIDAAKSLYKRFWEASVAICKNEAVLLSDNVLLSGRTASDEFITDRRQKTSVRHMREFLSHITNLDYADTSVIAVGDGIAVSVLKDKRIK